MLLRNADEVCFEAWSHCYPTGILLRGRVVPQTHHLPVMHQILSIVNDSPSRLERHLAFLMQHNVPSALFALSFSLRCLQGEVRGQFSH